jgi:hypothetical protein
MPRLARWSVWIASCLLCAAPGAARAAQGELAASSVGKLKQKDASALRKRPKLGRAGVSRDGRFAVDATGERFRVGFPLYERITLGAALPVSSGNQDMTWSAPALEAEVRLSLALGFDTEEVWWNMRHALLRTRAWSGSGDTWNVELTALDGWYLRHDLGSFVVIPVAEDLRIPAPFDIAVDYRLARLKLAHDGQQGWSLGRLDVVELAFMADFIRDPEYRKRLAIGPASWYHATPGDVWTHELSPMSAGKVLAGWDQRDGLASVYGEAVCGGALTFDSGGGTSTWRTGCRGELRAEWTPLAISNAPLSIPLTARADIPFKGDDPASWSVLVGLRLGVSLD